MNQFPKRQENMKKEIDDEIDKQRKQIVDEDEYLRLMTAWKSKGVKRIPFFLVDEKILQGWYVILNFKRLLSFINLVYIGMSAYSLISPKFIAVSSMLYGCTAASFAMNVGFSYMMRKSLKNMVTRIEWDVESENIVIFVPKKGGYQFAEEAKFLPPTQIVMKANVPIKDCLYYDASTG